MAPVSVSAVSVSVDSSVVLGDFDYEGLAAFQLISTDQKL